MTPVLFRFDRSGKHREVTAVLPTLPANRGNFVCYAHIGQHGECSGGWLATTRPATDSEAAGLLAELKQVGYDDLKVVRRITRAMRNEAWKGI